MNHFSASTHTDTGSFRQRTISFEKIPNQTKLFIDYQSDAGTINEFYPNKNRELSDFAAEVLENYKTDRGKLCDILLKQNREFNASEKALKNIEKLRDKEYVTVLTGQQAGLFSGSVYSIYKALSAIKLAEKLTHEGIKAVPVFWIASEDHDFDEISRTHLLNKDEELFESSSKPEYLIENIPVGFLDLEENIDKSIDELITQISKTEFSSKIKSILANSYRTGETYSSAFGKLLAKLFENYGLIYVSPLDQNLRKLSTPIYQRSIENAEKIKDKLIERDKLLNENEYHSQVLVENDFFPYFYIDEKNERKSMRFGDDYNFIKTIDGSEEFSKEELVTIANTEPHKLSPNALMRPVVQDYLFPTICYYGGGAEIAYFGQNAVIYDVLKRPVTPIRHRSSFTIIEGRHRRTLYKYELNFEDLFQGKENLLAFIIEKHLNSETAAVFDETKKLMERELDKLDKYLKKDDPTLSDNLSNRRKKIEWHLKTLRKKFHRSETLKHDVVHRRIEHLYTNLLPKHVLQERNLNILYFINIYSENLIDWLYNAVDTDEKDHQILIF